MPVTVRLLAALTAALVACSVAPASSVSAEPPADLAARLDAAIAAKLTELGVPGAIVGLSIPGRIDYLRAVGVSDTATGTPMTVDQHTRIGSVTKTFTGTAVLQLVDQGRLHLGDPIAQYIDGVPDGDTITLDMLGRMRSGLFNYSEDPTFQARLYAEAPTGPDAFTTTPAELLGYAFSHPLNFAPDTKFEYSNTNLVLLGLVVEKVSGQPLSDYFAQHIFGPLGLSQTSYPETAFIPEPFTHGYTALPDGAVVDTAFWNPSWGDAAGKIVSDYPDMRSWASALGKGTLLSPVTQARRLQTTDAEPGLGYAFAIFDSHGWIGHNGDIPGYTTVVVYLPQLDATLVVFANSDVAQPGPADQLAQVVTQIATPEHVYRLG